MDDFVLVQYLVTVADLPEYLDHVLLADVLPALRLLFHLLLQITLAELKEENVLLILFSLDDIVKLDYMRRFDPLEQLGFSLDDLQGGLGLFDLDYFYRDLLLAGGDFSKIHLPERSFSEHVFGDDVFTELTGGFHNK